MIFMAKKSFFGEADFSAIFSLFPGFWLLGVVTGGGSCVGIAEAVKRSFLELEGSEEKGTDAYFVSGEGAPEATSAGGGYFFSPEWIE
jgi:hypothetical protein